MKKFLSLVKFSHTIFALPFAIIGFVLALKFSEISFQAIDLLFVIICMVTARNAAMGFNRYIDRHIDKANPRTAEAREIPNGSISAKSALLFIILNCLVFWSVTWFINPLCFTLAPIVLAILLTYSYTKRFTALCHLILGLGLAIAPLAAWLAVTASFSMTPIWFSLAVLFWVSGFDIIYALQDQDFDKDHGLHSIPALMGTVKALRLSKFLHFSASLVLFIAGMTLEFQWLYWIGWSIFSGLLIYQHSLVKPGDLSKVNLAFFTTNGVASVVFASFVVAELLVY